MIGKALSGRYQIHTGLQHGVLWPTQSNGVPLNETMIGARLKQVLVSFLYKL
jgi:arylsulfatase B/arylsulfatase I/J